MTSILQNIFYDWYTNTGWIKKELHQRADEDHFIAEGEGLRLFKKTFNLQEYVHEKMFFPDDTNLQSLGKSWAYITLFVPHKLGTTAYNTYLVAKYTAQAGIAYFSKNKERLESIKAPILEAAKRTAFGWIAIAIPCVVYSYTPGFLVNHFSYFAFKIAVATAIFYPILHPKMTKVQAAKLELALDPQPLDDGQVANLTVEERKTAYKSGAYPLSRLLGMHLVGYSNGKKGNRDQFIDCEKKSS